MLTKNFYSCMRVALSESGITATFISTDGNTKTSSTSTKNYIYPFSKMNSWAKSVNEYGVSFGTGTTPATVSDYYLESILGSAQIEVSTPSKVSYSQGDTYDEYSVTFGVTNITAEAITISEVGLIERLGANNSAPHALVDRTVLDTPVTIPAGQSKQITYTIRFNYGDAV